MTKISKKLDNLEKNIVNSTPKGITRIEFDDPAEIRLHRKAHEIIKYLLAKMDELDRTLMENPNANIELDKEALEASIGKYEPILQRSESLILQRVWSLFDETFGWPIHRNDVFYKWVFNRRLAWFLGEMAAWLAKALQERQIMNMAGFWDLCAGEQQKRLASVYDNWPKDLFSEESWNRYNDKHPIQIHVPTEEEAREMTIKEKLYARQEAKIRKRCKKCKVKDSCQPYQDTVQKSAAPAVKAEEKL
jgi:hypothetical protein